MPWEQFIWLGAILFVGSTIQGAVGFGAGLFAIPAMVWIGFTLPQAIGALLVSVLFQGGLNCWRVRHQLPWKECMPFCGWRALALPLGVWAMVQIDSLDPASIKRVIGSFLLAALIVQITIKPRPRPRLHEGWTVLAGTLSGFTAGTVGMGGIPASLWVMAHDWPPLKQRSCLWLTFLVILPLHGGLLIYRYGEPLLAALVAASVLVPLSMAGAYLGANLGERMNRRQLTVAMVTLLFLIALRSILAPG